MLDCYCIERVAEYSGGDVGRNAGEKRLEIHRVVQIGSISQKCFVRIGMAQLVSFCSRFQVAGGI